MKLSIVIASHGGNRWQWLAETRALPSALAQDAHEVLREHDPSPHATRAEVRNRLAAQATGDWLCFLDADDELEAGYAQAMAAAEQPRSLLTPAVSYVQKKRRKPPKFWPVCDISGGNWMVVGTVLEKTLFDEVGGWRHLDGTGTTNEYDDWELWIRCTLAGADHVKVPDAIYVAHIETTSKHRTSNHQQRLAWHREVSNIHFPHIQV